MKRAARHKRGSVVYDKRRKTWYYLFCEDGTRHTKVIGTKREFPTKSAAWEAVESLRHSPEPTVAATEKLVTVSVLAEQYRQEWMPKKRFSTRYSYDQWLTNHVLPRWGTCSITELQSRPVQLWLESLALSPKSQVAIRGLISILWRFAMWRQYIPTQENPMQKRLVTIEGVTKRRKKPRSLTVGDFQKFVRHLPEPFRTIALLCACLGLRISECLALRWADVDWLNGKLAIERGIVRQRVDKVKTDDSERMIPIDGRLLEVLKAWKQVTQFGADGDYIFASPFKLGRLPWSYVWVWRVFQRATRDAGIGKLGTHTMRHSYRSWLDAVGTSVAVQQKLMRHADIRTTLNVYGDVVTDEMQTATAKVAGLALSRA